MFISFNDMSDEDFLQFCYSQILLRKPDQGGWEYHLERIKNKLVDKQNVLFEFLISEEYQSKIRNREFVPPGHYYSTHPSVQDIATCKRSPDLKSIDMNEEFQLKLLEKLAVYHDQCPFPDVKKRGFRYYFQNDSYSYADAIFLYGMMRHFSPAKIVEVGSGYSSCVMLDTNEMEFGSRIKISFVEPYPSCFKQLLLPTDFSGIMLYEMKVQEVDVAVIKNLNANDILFIDSSHVSKIGSDVNYLFFELLPSLNPGVIVHVHDIFWPFEYPNAWLSEGRFWNEAYLLRAFLQYNSNFEILLFSDYLQRKCPDWFENKMPQCLKNTGCSMWIRKKL